MSQKVLNKQLKISQTHLDRALADPITYAKRIAKLKIKGDEILEEYETQKQNRVSEPPNSYGNKIHDYEYGESEFVKRLGRIELSVDSLNNKLLDQTKQNKAVVERFEKRDEAYMNFLVSNRTEEDVQALRARFAEIERIYKAATTIQEFPAPPEGPTQ